METKRTKETLEARVRETPLRERLEQSGRRIGAMCSERRGPRMCIPVEYTDDDFFICTTIRDAVNTLDQARAALKLGLDYYRSKGTQKFNPYEVEQQLEKALAAMGDAGR